MIPEIKNKPIDKVTVTNLDAVLRMCHIEINKSVLDKIIDLVELIEEKGNETSIKDVFDLKSKWE